MGGFCPGVDVWGFLSGGFCPRTLWIIVVSRSELKFLIDTFYLNTLYVTRSYMSLYCFQDLYCPAQLLQEPINCASLMLKFHSEL